MEPCERQYDLYRSVPNDYDPRYQFPNCLTSVQTQGNHTSLAHAIATIVSDRYCIQSKSQLQANVSPQQLLECDEAGFALGKVDTASSFLATSREQRLFATRKHTESPRPTHYTPLYSAIQPKA